MSASPQWNIGEIFLAVIALIFILFLQSAIPFLMIPTLGQAVWTMGFAQSFTHGSFFTIYAHDFGFPKPAAIAFGLSGAWPASIFLRLGLSAADAYAAMAMSWLTVAFFATFIMARKFGNTRSMALLGAVAWMSMPTIWNHAGYSMLSLGISLLPLYFLALVKLLLIESDAKKPSRLSIIAYFLATILSVFMDGYTFMMFFTGATILCLFVMRTRIELRPVFKRTIFPVHIASFMCAYILYAVFVGRSHFGISGLDFFRGWGLDLSFIVLPTKGVHWLPDLLGLSVERSGQLYLGDASVWITTFSLPLILSGILAWWLSKKKTKVAAGIFIIAAFGFYMSLGPSLKINSMKPEAFQTAEFKQHKPLVSLGWKTIPTGSGLISHFLPGFNNMRASYRWSALWMFAFWWLVMISVARAKNKGRAVWSGILFVIILLNLPNISQKSQGGINIRNAFLKIDNSLIPMLQQQIKKGEVVAFIPWNNDFFVNYLAPKAEFRTFNIGGDKNLKDAQQQWPEEMLAAGPAPLDAEKMSAGIKLLEAGTTDVLVLPYIDLLWSAHNWPCGAEQAVAISGDDYTCLAQRRKNVEPFVAMLKARPNLIVTDSELFATVRLVKP